MTKEERARLEIYKVQGTLSQDQAVDYHALLVKEEKEVVKEEKSEVKEHFSTPYKVGKKK